MLGVAYKLRRIGAGKCFTSTGTPCNRKVSRKYSERIDFATYKKSKSLFDIFSKKESPLDPEFVKLLRCPITKNPLRYDEAENELIEDENGIVYAVVDGIPILTPSAAKSLHRFVESDDAEGK